MPAIMEKRIVFEPGDILHIGITCGNPDCGEEIFYPADRQLPEMRGCPYCRADWTAPNCEPHRLRREHFVAIIRELSTATSPPWIFKLTFPGDPA